MCKRQLISQQYYMKKAPRIILDEDNNASEIKASVQMNPAMQVEQNADFDIVFTKVVKPQAKSSAYVPPPAVKLEPPPPVLSPFTKPQPQQLPPAIQPFSVGKHVGFADPTNQLRDSTDFYNPSYQSRGPPQQQGQEEELHFDPPKAVQSSYNQAVISPDDKVFSKQKTESNSQDIWSVSSKQPNHSGAYYNNFRDAPAPPPPIVQPTYPSNQPAQPAPPVYQWQQQSGQLPPAIQPQPIPSSKPRPPPPPMTNAFSNPTPSPYENPTIAPPKVINKPAPPTLSFEKKPPVERNSIRLMNEPGQGSVYQQSGFQNSVFNKTLEQDKKYGGGSAYTQSPANVLPYYERSGLMFNPNWQNLLEDQRLSWDNHKNFPLEIIVFLNTLKNKYGSKPTKASAQSYKSLRIKEVVSAPRPLTEHINQYKGNESLRRSLQRQMRGYPVYRSIRGDGNCFYRAFICGYIQMALTNRYATYFLRLLFQLYCIRNTISTDCGDEQILPPNEMFHMVIHRLLQLFTQRISLSSDPKARSKVVTLFYSMLNERPFQFDMNLIIAVRCYLKHLVERSQNIVELGEDFRRQAIKDLMEYGMECEDNQIVIMELCNALKVKITLFYLLKGDNSVKLSEMNPIGFNKAMEVVVFFRPGHYDLIYTEEFSRVLYPSENQSVRLGANTTGRVNAYGAYGGNTGYNQGHEYNAYSPYGNSAYVPPPPATYRRN